MKHPIYFLFCWALVLLIVYVSVPLYVHWFDVVQEYWQVNPME